MLKASVRRSKLEIILCRRRFETMSNLALELGVSKRTIQRDIDILSESIPLFTTRGNHGGVFLLGNYSKERQCLKSCEIQVLTKVISLPNNRMQILKDSEKDVLRSVCSIYSPSTKDLFDLK